MWKEVFENDGSIREIPDGAYIRYCFATGGGRLDWFGGTPAGPGNPGAPGVRGEPARRAAWSRVDGGLSLASFTPCHTPVHEFRVCDPQPQGPKTNATVKAVFYWVPLNDPERGR